MNHTLTKTIEMNASLGLEEFLTIAVSFVIAIILIWSFLTQKEEIKKRQRPWIASYASDVREPVILGGRHIDFHYINRGPVPAFRVQTRTYHSTHAPLPDEDTFSNLKPDAAFDLGPSESANNRIKLEDGIIDPTTNAGTVYFGIRIDYLDVDKKTKRFYEYRGHFKDEIQEIDNITMN